MTMSRATASPIVSPEEVYALLVRAAIEGSVIGQVATLATTTTPAVRFPVVVAAPSANWVNEGAEIPLSDAVLDEVTAALAKLAGLTLCTAELLADSVDGSAAVILGQGLARDLSRKLDEAAFAGMAAPAPAGLATLAGFSAVDAPADWENLDSFVAAVGAVEAECAKVTAWVANPVDTTALALMKTGAGSNATLLDADPTSVTGRSILGRPGFSTPAVPVGTVWGLDSSRVCSSSARTPASTSTPASSSPPTGSRPGAKCGNACGTRSTDRGVVAHVH